MWLLWLNEIESFSQLPGFFTDFCKDREKEVMIYKLIEGVEHDLKDDPAGAASTMTPE